MEPITVIGVAFFIGLPFLMITVKVMSRDDNQADFPKYKPMVKK